MIILAHQSLHHQLKLRGKCPDMGMLLIWAPAVKNLLTTESSRQLTNTIEKHIEASLLGRNLLLKFVIFFMFTIF